MSALQWRKIHGVAMIVWAALALPTVLFWKESILWVAFMSLYANFVGHASAWQAARAEDESATNPPKPDQDV